MIRCCEECEPACDWCIHFDSKKWLCTLDSHPTHPGKYCEHFECEDSKMYIIFTGFWGFVSFIIGLVTWSFLPWERRYPKWVSHAAVVDGNSLIEASFTKRKVIKKRYQKAPGWEFRVDLTPLLEPSEILVARGILERLVGKKYDTLGAVFGYTFNRKEWNELEDFYCFEVVRLAFPMITDKRPDRTTPRHLWRGLKRMAKRKGVSWKEIVTYR